MPLPAPIPGQPLPPAAQIAPVQDLGDDSAPAGGGTLIAADTPERGAGSGDWFLAESAPGSADGGQPSRADRRTARQRLRETDYDDRRKVVRALRGCLDRLPDRQSNVLVLRYGIGELRPRSASEVAHALNVTAQRYARIHRRGFLNLVMAARRTACEGGGVANETIAAAFAVAWGFQAGSAVASLAGDAPEVETGAVLGVQASSRHPAANGGTDSSGEDTERDASFGGLRPGTDGPLSVLLLAVMLAGALWIVQSFRRALN